MMKSDERIRLGISACLLGERVRHDGDHKHDPFLTDILGRYVEYVPVCPEYECGLSIPREPMSLFGDPDDPRLITVHTGIDHTDRMKQFSIRKARELEAEDLRGFIFKTKSPSSGMDRIDVFDADGLSRATGAGLFARIIMEYFTDLPFEDDERLRDPHLRRLFLDRVFDGHSDVPETLLGD